VSLAWLVPMVSAGVLGSAHCIGMCGGLIAVASDGAGSFEQRAVVQAGYQAARLASYVVLGAVAGGLGRALDLAGQAAGLGKAAAVVAGGIMTLWGLLAMLEATGALKRKLPGLRLLPPRVVIWLASLRERTPLARAVLLGGASALLPCGFLYAFAFAGAATGSPLGGMAVMAALWLGNLPALLGFGLLLAGALSRLRRHIPLLSAASVLMLGLFTLNSRVNVPAFALASVMGVAAGKSEQSAPMPADCPFHKKSHAP
jgi:sulfite exporter TauE/SafE